MIIDITKENICVKSKRTNIVYQVYAIKLENNVIKEYLIDNKYADFHPGMQRWKANNFGKMEKIPLCTNCYINKYCKKCRCFN